MDSGEGEDESEGRGMRSQVSDLRNLFFFFVADILYQVFYKILWIRDYAVLKDI